jgi:hypothetical protein
VERLDIVLDMQKIVVNTTLLDEGILAFGANDVQSQCQIASLFAIILKKIGDALNEAILC